MKKTIIFLLTFCIAHFSLAQDVESKTLDTDEYSVQYPANWELNTTGQSGTAFIILSPQDGPGDTFKENVNLIIQDDPQMDLEEFAQFSMTQIISAGAKVEESEQGGEPLRQKVIFTMSQSGYELKLMQYYWVINGKAFVLTFTCLKDQEEKYWEAGQQIMDSFKIK